MRCEFLTAVWGPWHTHVFAELALPSLLAKGNFPAFVRHLECSYFIHTSARDAEIIAASEGFQALSRFMKVRLVTHPERVFGDPVETHVKIWLNGVKRAQRRNAFIAALPADMVWADGAYESVAAALKNGKKAIYAMFIRVTSETFIDAYDKIAERDFATGGSSISPRALMQLTQRHIHPLHAAYLRDSDHFPFHSEYILWPVASEGFLMRSLATTVLMFHAVDYAVNPQFSLASNERPEEVSFMTDSDQMCGVSLTPMLKDMDWYLHPRRADLDEIGAWWIRFDGPAHLDLARQHFRFHETHVTERLWRQAERQSDFFVTQAVISREITRVGRALKDHNCTSAAKCLAVAHYAGRLRRHWRWRGPVTVFAPTENAFEALPADAFAAILSTGAGRELREMILAHVVAGAMPLTAGHETRTAAGSVLKVSTQGQWVRINGHALIDTIALPHGLTIHVVDGLLIPSA